MKTYTKEGYENALEKLERKFKNDMADAKSNSYTVHDRLDREEQIRDRFNRDVVRLKKDYYNI